MSTKIMNAPELNETHIGSSFDDFLKEEGIFDECNDEAVKEVIAWQLEQAMKEQGLNKTTLARRMHTSRSAVERCLDPENRSLTLQTLQKMAAALGKQLHMELR